MCDGLEEVGMRLLHTSDWHLGRTLFQTSLLAEQGRFLAWLLDTAREQRVDAVLVSGDVYDRAVPPLEAVALLDSAFEAFSEADIPLVVVSGNHDSAVRLGFGSGLAERAGVHLRTTLDDLARPVLLADEHGPVAVYGLPFLLPDAVKDRLHAERSHESVLRAAVAQILADSEQRGVGRTVVLSHAFVVGGAPSESERDLAVGGIGDAPAAVFDGITYVALGHLHRPQEISLPGSTTRLRYSGSPLAFSFGEKHDTKSVVVIELDAAGVSSVDTLPTPVPRPMREVRGRLDELLALDDPELARSWIKAVITDPSRPVSPMERLRERWPHTLVLEFAPDVDRVSSDDDMARLRRTTDPVEIATMFVEYVDTLPPTPDEAALLARAVETVRDVEVAAG
ncbi:MAG TPA: exonuclease SbcCD subunit D [Candidatus Nanopelagicales bacterium]|nr:exonuclease SbcCD subunit D [Candidatus Nanopelagicales bacterium]